MSNKGGFLLKGYVVVFPTKEHVLKGLASVLYGVVDVFPCCLAAIAMVYKKDDFAVVWSGIHYQNSPQRLAKNRLEIMSRTNSSPEQCSSGFLDQPEKFPYFFQNLCKICALSSKY